MKYLGILVGIFFLLGYNHLHAEESPECIEITEKATAMHWDYVNHENNVTLTMSYNMTAKMNKVCRLSKL